MVKISDIIRNSVNILEKFSVDSAEFDVRCIAEDITGLSFGQIMLDYGRFLTDEQELKFSEMVKKRAEGYPLQYILGEWEFYGLPFKVGEGVLIPRSDTETLVDVVIDYCKGIKRPKIADLCSGSGCIAVSLEKNTDSDTYAFELSDLAYRYLEENIKLNKSGVKPVKADVLSADTADFCTDFDVIVSNPPYLTENDMKNLQREVSFEPKTALYGLTSDGLEFYRTIPVIWRNSLKSGGLLAFEIGMGQENDVSDILIKNDFYDIKTYKDLAGITRVVTGIKK